MRRKIINWIIVMCVIFIPFLYSCQNDMVIENESISDTEMLAAMSETTIKKMLNQMFDKKGSNLTDNQWNKLLGEMTALLKKYEKLQSLANFICSKSGKVKFVINPNASFLNPDQPAAYSKWDRNITVLSENDLTGYKLLHEFLHFGQHIYYSDLPNKSARNIEFEVAVIIDLLNDNTVEGYKGMYYEPVKMQAYWAWMKDLRLNGVAELYRFNTLAEGFSLYANKTFDPDFTPFFLRAVWFLNGY